MLVVLAEDERLLPRRPLAGDSDPPRDRLHRARRLRGQDAARSGVRLIKDLDLSITGRDVLLVEDVVDTGLTLNYVCRTLGLREPASLAGGDVPRPAVPPPRRRPTGALRRLHGAGRVLRRLRVRPRRAVPAPAGPAAPESLRLERPQDGIRLTVSTAVGKENHWAGGDRPAEDLARSLRHPLPRVLGDVEHST